MRSNYVVNLSYFWDRQLVRVHGEIYEIIVNNYPICHFLSSGSINAGIFLDCVKGGLVHIRLWCKRGVTGTKKFRTSCQGGLEEKQDPEGLWRYGIRRWIAEIVFSSFKRVLGESLHSKKFLCQKAEASFKVMLLQQVHVRLAREKSKFQDEIIEEKELGRIVRSEFCYLCERLRRQIVFVLPFEGYWGFSLN